MKRSLLLLVTFCAFAVPFYSNAQTADASTSTELATKSLDMARNILKVAAGLADDFAAYKGDFLQKDNSGNSYYAVKGFDLGADAQYVIMRANGASTYAAIFDPKDDSDQTPTLAFAAFTGGIITIRQNNDITVEQDAAASTGSTLKYYLKAKDIKIASFTFDVGKKSGTLLVAIQ